MSTEKKNLPERAPHTEPGRYEFTNPSDYTTFEAANEAIAWWCAWRVSGMGGYTLLNEHWQSAEPEVSTGFWNMKTWEQINAEALVLTGTIVAPPAPEGENERTICAEFEAWLEANNEAIVACFLSFTYVTRTQWADYNRALRLIDDPEKRRQYIEEANDERRSSMNNICERAHQMGKGLIGWPEKKRAEREAAAAQTPA